MWIGRFKIWHKESLAMEASVGLDAEALTYLLGMFREGGRMYQSRVAYFEGPQKDLFKRRFLSDPRLRTLRLDGDQLFYALPASEVSHVESLGANLFFVKPVLVKNGMAHWTVASWDKKNLMELVRKLRKLAPSVRVELISLSKGSLNLFLPHALARLTRLQKNALDLAVEEGYYEIPRRIDLASLAKKHGLARTTFQSHLRRAERCLLKAVGSQGHF